MLVSVGEDAPNVTERDNYSRRCEVDTKFIGVSSLSLLLAWTQLFGRSQGAWSWA